MSNQSFSTDQSLNISNQKYPLKNNTNNNYYYDNINKNIKDRMNFPKINQNKYIPQRESNYSIFQGNKRMIKNSESFNLDIKKQLNEEEASFYSQKPVQTFELNLNSNNNNITNNKTNNIVNIDNQSSAFELFYIAKKKQKINFKITTIYQIGPEQKPLILTFLAEKKKIENNINNNINNNIINELNIQNTSFISNKQMENNSFAENEINIMNNNLNKKNELKIMQNPGRKSENKPKPILQIMTNSNKSNYPKKLSESNMPQVNGFSLEDNNNMNESLKNNFGNISKSASMIVNNNNNNQDISFISNLKETENLLEMNDNNYNNKNSNYGFLGLENNNVYNGYIMINKQLSFIAEKKDNKNLNKNNISNISNNSKNNSVIKTNAKKYIKIEYYDTQPVSFEILSDIYLEENLININNNLNINKINEIKLFSYKMYRVEEMQFIKENKENEDKKFDKEENINSNNNTTIKKKRRRRKKKNQ